MVKIGYCWECDNKDASIRELKRELEAEKARIAQLAKARLAVEVARDHADKARDLFGNKYRRAMKALTAIIRAENIPGHLEEECDRLRERVEALKVALVRLHQVYMRDGYPLEEPYGNDHIHRERAEADGAADDHGQVATGHEAVALRPAACMWAEKSFLKK